MTFDYEESRCKLATIKAVLHSVKYFVIVVQRVRYKHLQSCTLRKGCFEILKKVTWSWWNRQPTFTFEIVSCKTPKEIWRDVSSEKKVSRVAKYSESRHQRIATTTMIHEEGYEGLNLNTVGRKYECAAQDNGRIGNDVISHAEAAGKEERGGGRWIFHVAPGWWWVSVELCPVFPVNASDDVCSSVCNWNVWTLRLQQVLYERGERNTCL